MNSRPFKPLLLAVFVSLFYQPCGSQIVNAESFRKKTDTTGFAGSVAMNGTYLDNEKVIFTLGFVPHVQYKWKQDLLLMVGDYKITKSNKIAFEDAAFLHFRYNHEYTDLLRWESFTQIQDNKISKLKYRILLGSGIRLKLMGTDLFRLYLGVIPMYEVEQINNLEQTINKYVRVSQYISMTLNISTHTQLYSTSYYQPRIDAFIDYRFFNEQKLSVHLLKNLYLNVSTVYTWDNFPPEGAPARTFQTKTGLQYKF